jgi:hypothetical protein
MLSSLSLIARPIAQVIKLIHQQIPPVIGSMTTAMIAPPAKHMNAMHHQNRQQTVKKYS